MRERRNEQLGEKALLGLKGLLFSAVREVGVQKSRIPAVVACGDSGDMYKTFY